MFEVEDFVEGPVERREPIRHETPSERIARIARGDLTRDETFVVRRRLGLDLTPGDRLLQAAKLENQQRAARRAFIAREELREKNRMRVEARRLLRFGSQTPVADGMRAQELRDIESRSRAIGTQPPESADGRRERLRGFRERLNQTALTFD